MIYIIADDLTGSNDTGVQFAKKGYKTIVLIIEDIQLPLSFETNYDVVVLDSETRNDCEKDARRKLIEILNKVKFVKEDVIYKKIDSTLRGNVGAEIEEIMRVCNKSICILSPSFPSHQRITLKGHFLLQEPHDSNNHDCNSDIKIKECSFIPYILGKQTKLPIERIDITDVAKGQEGITNILNNLNKKEKQIIVADSNNDKNLEDLVLSGLDYSDSVLFAGSAGLANYLAKNHENRFTKAKKVYRSKPILIVGGSRNPVMVDQINFLKENMYFKELRIDVRDIFMQKNQLLSTYGNECLKILNNNEDLIIFTEATESEQRGIDQELIRKYRITFRELGNKIKETFGMLTAYLVHKSDIRNLILTGGDIAVGVCKELNINQLEILNELLPGIPLTRTTYQGKYLNIITKAGGFGQEEALYQLINKFRNYDKNIANQEN